jgi:hypothetical protein
MPKLLDGVENPDWGKYALSSVTNLILEIIEPTIWRGKSQLSTV